MLPLSYHRVRDEVSGMEVSGERELRIGICEDEKIYSDRIVSALKGFFHKEQEVLRLEVYQDGNQLLKKMSSGAVYDLLLMDLQLENSDGIEIAGKIRNIDPQIPLIIVTGMEERVLEGYGVDALDYVLKSNLEQRLEAALQRFLKKRRESSLLFHDGEGQLVILRTSEVLWVESERRGTRIVTCKMSYSCSLPIGKITSQLPEEEYLEIHKAVFVRVDQIKKIGSDQVVMSNDTQLPLSRRKKKEVMRRVLETVRGRME